ncbi:TlpA family protein disulfide reductase [Aliiglaciecola litoralis]|uniref:TlpA family protein disulfide reductase n=1 Tax=Aliiglaciecola litoralis TaxID=582857 RepID=A0ABN1LLE8_9ALTE
MKWIVKHKARLLRWSRDLLIGASIIYAITLWQGRHLLDDDGTVVVDNVHLATLNNDVQPLFVSDKRTLVYFFAPWCAICELSIGNLDHLSDPELRVVRVALDYQSQNEVEDFVNRSNVKGVVLLGSNQLKQKFKVPGYPTYYLLNEQQQVVGHSFGYSSAMGLKLKNYLNK